MSISNHLDCDHSKIELCSFTGMSFSTRKYSDCAHEGMRTTRRTRIIHFSNFQFLEKRVETCRVCFLFYVGRKDKIYYTINIFQEIFIGREVNGPKSSTPIISMSQNMNALVRRPSHV